MCIVCQLASDCSFTVKRSDKNCKNNSEWRNFYSNSGLNNSNWGYYCKYCNQQQQSFHQFLGKHIWSCLLVFLLNVSVTTLGDEVFKTISCHVISICNIVSKRCKILNLLRMYYCTTKPNVYCPIMWLSAYHRMTRGINLIWSYIYIHQLVS